MSFFHQAFIGPALISAAVFLLTGCGNTYRPGTKITANTYSLQGSNVVTGPSSGIERIGEYNCPKVTDVQPYNVDWKNNDSPYGDNITGRFRVCRNANPATSGTIWVRGVMPSPGVCVVPVSLAGSSLPKGIKDSSGQWVYQCVRKDPYSSNGPALNFGTVAFDGVVIISDDATSRNDLATALAYWQNGYDYYGYHAIGRIPAAQIQ